MQPIRAFALFVLISTGAAFAQKQSSMTPISSVALAQAPASDEDPKEPQALHSFDLTAIDKSVDPCVDFYQYACGNWRKNNPIPADQTIWGRFNELVERDNYLLYSILKKASEPSPDRTPLQRQYGDFFAACMNVPLANEKGAQPILPLLQRVATLQDKEQIASLVGDLQSGHLASPFFNIDSDQDLKDSTREIAALRQGGLSLPDRDYYLETDERMTKIRQQYNDYMITVFKLAGDSPEQAADEAKNVLDVETALAKGSMSRTELRDPEKRYHPMQMSGLAQLAPDFNWKQYFASINEGPLASLNVTTPDFFK